jgi:hypothetical protein
MARKKPHLVPEPETPVVPATQASTETQPNTSAEAQLDTATVEQLDEEEKEFAAIRRDQPGVKGTAAIGIVSISVGKAPAKNEFFRVHQDFRPITPLVDKEIGLEKHYFAVTKEMVEALAVIEISVSDYVLYLTVTSGGAVRIVPVRCANDDGNASEYTRTKEIAMFRAMDEWVRLSTDTANQCYKVFPAPAGRFGEPKFPELKPAKIFRLAFRDKGRLIDSVQHPLFQKWAARDSDK